MPLVKKKPGVGIKNYVNKRGGSKTIVKIGLGISLFVGINYFYWSYNCWKRRQSLHQEALSVYTLKNMSTSTKQDPTLTNPSKSTASIASESTYKS